MDKTLSAPKMGSPKRRAILDFGPIYLAIINYNVLLNNFFLYKPQNKDYTFLLFGGRQPLCGNGVTSIISVTSIPEPCTARIADSRPLPGPLT